MVEKQTYEELEQRIALLENELDHQKRFEEINRSLLKISDAVNMSSSLDELFQKIHLALEPVIDTSNFFIALYDRTKDSIVFPYCVDTIDESYPPVIDASKTASLTAAVIRTGCPLMLTKTEIETQRAKSRLKIPTCTPSEIWLGVPLKTRDEIIGVMAVQSYHDPMCYDQTDMDVMVSVAAQVAIAIVRKRIEDALREREENYRWLLNNMSDLIAVMDMSLRFTFVSPSIMRMRGYTVEEALTQTFEQIMTPESLQLSAKVFEEELELEASGKADPDRVRIMEVEEYKKDGSIVLIESHLSFMRDEPAKKPVGIISVSHDVTDLRRVEKALRESEEKHKGMIANISDVIAIMDEDGTIRYKSPNVEKWFGWKPEDLVGTDGWETVHPEDMERIQKEFLKLIDKDNSAETVEYRYKCKDGSYKMIELTAVNLTNDPLIRGVLMNYHDITERKQGEEEKEQLEALNRQLQKAESLGRMAGAIAHHFNNQLYAVMGNLEIAMEDLTGGVDISEILSEAHKAALKAADVSRLLLTYLGQTPGKHEPIYLSEAYRQSLALLQAAAPKGMILNAEFPFCGPVISADAGQMQQILANLVTNAWESTSDNRGTIGLTVKTVSHEDIPVSKRFPIGWQPQEIDHACLEVSDTGSGIANKDSRCAAWPESCSLA